MGKQIEISELRSFTQAEIWPIIAGYETQEIFALEKNETDQRIIFEFRLTRLVNPFQDNFYEDFSPEEMEWYSSLVPKGYCFGAYHEGRLIGFALAEAISDEHLARVWEFHVMDGFRRQGVGRALMERVFEKAISDDLPMVMLETQNTNINAIRFYRSMGFAVEAIDLSPPQYKRADGSATGQSAFYMKRKLLNDRLKAPPGGTEELS
jgi:ribosomal protein S18 acetylase RimI-like enzyme